MIRGRYGLLIGLAIIAMLSVAGGAGLFMVYAPLPDPATATSEQLFRWLVTRDLSQESPEVQAAFVHRVDGELGKTGDLSEGIAQLSASHRAMLWSNIGTLLSPWLLEKADEYARLPALQRPGYVDHFLDRVDQWSKIGEACLHGDSTSGATSNNSLSELITERIAACSRTAGPVERKHISDFMADVQLRWIRRQFSGFSFFGGK